MAGAWLLLLLSGTSGGLTPTTGSPCLTLGAPQLVGLVLGPAGAAVGLELAPPAPAVGLTLGPVESC